MTTNINSGIMKNRFIDAVQENNIGAVRGFLERGLNPNFDKYITDLGLNEFMSPLMLSVQNTNMTITLLLLGAGANVNYTNDTGSSLHWIIFENNLQLLRLFLIEGANPFIRDTDGHTAYDISMSESFDDEAEILKYYMDIFRVQRINRRRMTRNRVKTLKNSRRLALMKSMESRDGPMSSVRYDPSLLEHISSYL